MATLQQDSESVTYYTGWYGACEGDDIFGVDAPCEDFGILSQDQGGSWTRTVPGIDKVWSINEENKGTRIYDSGTFDFLLGSSQIKKLECGRGYRIKLKKGADTITIPHLILADAGTQDEYRVTMTENCEVDTGCPTCEDYTGSSSTFNIDLKNLPTTAQESVHVVVYDASVEGTLCHGEVDSGLPKTYYMFVESATEPFASITIAGVFRNTEHKIKYTVDDQCYGAEPTQETYAEGDINVYRFESIGTVVEPTPTPSETPSPTNVPTPTETPSPSETPSNVPTPTETPSPSVTPDNVPTPTETPSPSETPSHTPSPTFTPSPSETVTPEEQVEPCCDAGMITGIVKNEVVEISMEVTAQPFDCNGTLCLESNVTDSIPSSTKINVNGTYMGTLGVQGTLDTGTQVRLTISSTTNALFTDLVGKCLEGTISDNICNLTE
jgi:hypothetical protein